MAESLMRNSLWQKEDCSRFLDQQRRTLGHPPLCGPSEQWQRQWLTTGAIFHQMQGQS